MRLVESFSYDTTTTTFSSCNTACKYIQCTLVRRVITFGGLYNNQIKKMEALFFSGRSHCNSNRYAFEVEFLSNAVGQEPTDGVTEGGLARDKGNKGRGPGLDLRHILDPPNLLTSSFKPPCNFLLKPRIEFSG